MIDLQPDIKENDILALSPELLGILLKDHTLSTDTGQANIFWATDNYADRGEGYQYYDQITIEAITGKNGNIIVPRALKTREQQQQRSRDLVYILCILHTTSIGLVCGMKCSRRNHSKNIRPFGIRQLQKTSLSSARLRWLNQLPAALYLASAKERPICGHRKT